MIRSHPPPQAGCPLRDPGPLAVLTLERSTEVSILTTVWREYFG